MPTIYNQNYESSTSLPAGWNFDAGFAIDATSALSGANTLAVSSTGAKSAIYATQDARSGNVTASTRFKFATPGASSAVHLTARLSDPNPANYLTTANSYRVEITCGSAAANWRLVRQNGATANVLSNVSTFATALVAGTAYEAFLTTNGGSTPGTRIGLEIRRVSDNLWLTSAATWVAARTRCIAPVDNGSVGTGGPIAGQGYAGVRSDLASGCTLYLDEFTLTDFLDPSIYSKSWADLTGWTATNAAAATAGVFGSEAAVVLAGDGGTNSITSSLNDQQYGNAITFNCQFKFASAYATVTTAGFSVRGYRLNIQGATNVISLQDPSAANVATITFTAANWTVGRAYRLLGVCSGAAIQFAIQDTVTGNYLQPGGTFGSGFTWAFNYTPATPANPGLNVQFFCNSSSAFSIGTFTAGPTGTATATPNPASVPAGGSVAIAPAYFDGVATSPSVTSGGGSYSGGSYIAPGAVGSANLRFAATYRPSQTVDVPITINATPATSFTIIAPSPASGLVGSASGNFTVVPNGLIAGGIVTITPSGGGLSTPITLTFSNSGAAQTFTITPTSAGTVTLTPTNSAGLTNPPATTYAATTPLTNVYVAANGSDSTTTGAIGAPFLTIPVAIAATPVGATINLRGGDTFTTGVSLTPSTGGRTVQSYGTGQATISTTAASAFRVQDCDGVSALNLALTTPSGTGNAGYRPFVALSTDGVRRSAGMTVSGCTLIGGPQGILFQGASGGTGGWNGVTITGNVVDGATATGIALSDSANGSGLHFSNVLVQGNTVRNISGANGTGSGIVMGNCDSVTGAGAARCFARGNHVYNCGSLNAGTAGPGGMYPIYADDVYFEDNLIHDIFTSSAGFDGGGLDCDLGTTNCVYQRNYVYNVGGPGFLVFSPAGGHVIRWNVFANCGTSNVAGLAGIRVDDVGGCLFHNNLVYMGSSTNGALSIPTGAKAANKQFYNNTFVSASGVPTVDIPSIDSTFKLEGNAYQSGTAFLNRFLGTNTATLAGFRAAIGRETGHGFASTVPFAGYGSAIPTPTDPTTIRSIAAFDVPSGSPLAGAGLDLQSLYSINPGPLDFRGAAVAAPYSVGASAVPATSTNATGYTLTSSTTSAAVGSPVTITATITGGSTLSAPLVITLADLLGSAISGTIAIAGGSTAGSATVTPSAAGAHAITATHAGGGFAGGDSSTSFVATAVATPVPPATTYALDFGSDAPVAGQQYKITARLPIGTTLAASVTVTLAGTNIQYSATQGGPLAATGTITISSATGTGFAYFAATAAGPVVPSAANGSGLTNPTIAAFVASAPASTSATGYGLYFPPAVAGVPSQGIAYLTGGASLGSNLVITPSGAGLTLPGTITIAAGQSSATFPFTVAQPGSASVTATHAGAPGIADPGPSTMTASSSPASTSGLGGLQPSGSSFVNLLSGGLPVMIDAVAAANPTLSSPAVALIHDASGGSLDRAYYGLAQLVDSYLHGDPIANTEINSRLADYVSVFTSVAQATTEVAALVQASPGSLSIPTSTIRANPAMTRVFS